jgi:hypothetical protein
MANITVSVNRNFDDANATALAGSISSSTASAIVTGVGTAFNATNTPVGCPIYSGTIYLGNVLSIQSVTQLTLTANALATVTGATNGFAYLNLALNNQEVVTITNGATLTVNSDNLYSQQAAYPYYFRVSNGTLNFDGTTVWWIPFDASSGNVPALGTQGTDNVTISGGNVGEFLEIYTALGTAPLAAGVAMPATGFVKLRRKTGTINDNDVLTFTGGATATVNSATGGQRGWLQIVMQSNGNFQRSNGIWCDPQGTTNFNGDWFELGTATGSAGMTIQHYAPDYCPAVQIETSAGSGVYEWWCAFGTTDSGTFDTNAKIFLSSGTGLMTFGGTTWGAIPPSGAKIRVPNLHIQSAFNNVLQTANTVALDYRPHFRESGRFFITRTVVNAFSGYEGGGQSQDFTECAILDSVGNFASANPTKARLYMLNCAIGSAGSIAPAVCHRECDYNYIENCVICKGNASGGILLSNCKNITLIGNRIFSSNSTQVTLNYSQNITATNNTIISGGSAQYCISMTASSLFSFTNTLMAGRTKLTGNHAYHMVILAGCTDGVFDGVGYPANYPYWPQYDYFALSNNCQRIHFRNIGTLTSPFTVQNSGTARSLVLKSGSSDIHITKCYVSGTYVTPNGTGSDVIVSDSGVPAFTGAPWDYVTSTTGILQRVYSSTMPGNTGGYRQCQFAEVLVSATSLVFYLNPQVEKFPNSALDEANYTEDSGGPFFRTTSIFMPTAGNQITWTWNYRILGMTAFANTAPVISGANAANFTFSYDLDKGAGFSGTFKAFTAANLSAETGISPTGLRIRIRALVNTSNSANALSRIIFYGVTSAADCAANPYPYNNPPVSVTGGLAGSIYSIFRVSDGKRLDTRTGSGSVTLLPDWYANTTVMLRVRKPGYDPVTSEFTLTERVASIPVSQLDNAIPDTNPGAKAITITNHGASPVTWNSKQWSITVTVTDGSSAATIAQYLSWQTAQDDYNLLSGFHNTALPVMVIPVGTGYETARGVLYGSAGATLKGVRVVDGSGNEVPGFARMQADDGTYYSPAASYTLTVSNIVNDSRILVRRTDTLAVIANQTVTTGSFAYTYTHTVDIPIEIVVRKATSSPYYQEWRTTTTLSNSNNTQTANQLSDT